MIVTSWSWTMYCFECDGCGELEEIEADSFSEAWLGIEEEGWKAFKEDGAWQHHCPSCR